MTDQRSWVVTDTNTGAESNQRFVLWNEFRSDESPHLSLPSIVREQREHFRERMLQTLDDVAAHRIGEQTVEEALQLETGLSLFHMTLVWAKRWGELGVLANATKLLALTDLLKVERPTHVEIRLKNRCVSAALSTTCTRLGIDCTSIDAPDQPRWLFLRALRHLLRAFSFARASNDTSDFMIADYLFRVDPDQLSRGSFRSGYWEHLPNEIERSGSEITWLHRFSPHPLIPTVRTARRLLNGLPRHHLLDQVHGLGEAWRVWRTYRQIGRLQIDACQAFVADDCDLWPVFQRDWVESFHGPHPMSLAINMVNLRRLLPNDRSRTLLYIYENQPWEFALRHYSGNETKTIAVPHATVRFWDLRYFVSPTSRRHLPDHVAVNSPVARAELLAGGYEASTLHDVEALMYQGSQVRVHPTTQRSGILVLGELEVASTQRYLDWVVRTAGGRAITFKPHPLINVDSFSVDSDRVQLTSASSDDLVREAQVVVLGASGTATLEAIAAGVPVVAVLNPCELDLSVVSRHPLVRHVATEAELGDALNAAMTLSGQGESVFFVDHRLARWKQLLGLG